MLHQIARYCNIGTCTVFSLRVSLTLQWHLQLIEKAVRCRKQAQNVPFPNHILVWTGPKCMYNLTKHFSYFLLFDLLSIQYHQKCFFCFFLIVSTSPKKFIQAQILWADNFLYFLPLDCLSLNNVPCYLGRLTNTSSCYGEERGVLCSPNTLPLPTTSKDWWAAILCIFCCWV